MTKREIIKEIERRIEEYENNAEEHFQELDSPEEGNALLDIVTELKLLLQFIKLDGELLP